MANRNVPWRMGAVALGALALVGVAGAAVADEVDNDDVDVTVTIAEVDQPGVLAMTVAGDETTLTEQGSTASVRRYTGQLPAVTVTDTRTADEIPDGAFWAVTGQASSFIGDAAQPAITADHLGWTPSVADPGGTGAVEAGDPIDTVMDDTNYNFGLVGEELLALSYDSVEAIGSWTANAELVLKVPASTPSGNYSSILTLSLFE